MFETSPGLLRREYRLAMTLNLLYLQNMSSNNSILRLIVFILVGLVLGGILGECLGLLFAQIGELTGAGIDNTPRTALTAAWDLRLGYSADGAPQIIDLYMIQFPLAFTLKLNIVSVIGMAVSIYIMKWSGKR
jgi:hypothetical protein